MGQPIVDVTPELVGLSGALEGGVSAAQSASAAAGSAALLGVLPMGADVSSVEFAAALSAAGAAYLAAVGEHCVQRAGFGAAQGITAATFEVTEVVRAAASAL